MKHILMLLTGMLISAPVLAGGMGKPAAPAPASFQKFRPAGTWLTLNPENVLVIETTKGTMMVEMRPDLSPKAVERIKLLAREGVYDGLQFHRVIDQWVAQTGNPNNKDGGTSSYSNLEPEFSGYLPLNTDWTTVTHSADGNSGFLGSLPIFTASDTDTRRRAENNFQAWGAYCSGVAGMGRGDDIGSANSEIFFMRGVSAFRLGLNYTAWGNTVVGKQVIEALNAGEPPVQPDIMKRVYVLADVAASQRPVVQILSPNSAQFQKTIASARASKGADFSICDLEVPTRLIQK